MSKIGLGSRGFLLRLHGGSVYFCFVNLALLLSLHISVCMPDANNLSYVFPPLWYKRMPIVSKFNTLRVMFTLGGKEAIPLYNYLQHHSVALGWPTADFTSSAFIFGYMP